MPFILCVAGLASACASSAGTGPLDGANGNSPPPANPGEGGAPVTPPVGPDGGGGAIPPDGWGGDPEGGYYPWWDGAPFDPEGGVFTDGASPTPEVSDLPPLPACDPSATRAPSTAARATARLRENMVGTWDGTVRTPWTPEYQATLRFTGDGHYEARSRGMHNSTLYYNDDNYPAEARAAINAERDDGSVYGPFYFGIYGGSTVGVIDHIVMSADLRSLSFDVYRDAEEVYGPVHFEAHRTCF